MRFLLLPLAGLAFLGLVLSAISHGCALFSLPQPLGRAAFALHVGIFVVWIPAILAAERLNRGRQRADYWKTTLRGCPRWMSWLTGALFVYAIINFITFLPAAPGRRERRAMTETPPVVYRGFSGHWMAFYAAAAAILYSAHATSRTDLERRCPKGHPASPDASFCQQCGARIDG